MRGVESKRESTRAAQKFAHAVTTGNLRRVMALPGEYFPRQKRGQSRCRIERCKRDRS
jgi:hypothetical protein